MVAWRGVAWPGAGNAGLSARLTWGPLGPIGAQPTTNRKWPADQSAAVVITTPFQDPPVFSNLVLRFDPATGEVEEKSGEQSRVEERREEKRREEKRREEKRREEKR